MEFARYAPWLVLVVVALAGFLWWRARRERERLSAIRRLQEAVSEEEAFLDSSHISGPIPGLPEQGGDAAARAAAALRRAGPPSK
jgi:hypothetical protein